MDTGKTPWYLHLSLMNTEKRRISDIRYPCTKFEMFESLACCWVPYGSESYCHLAESLDGYQGDSLQKALRSAIENKEYPPSMQELNYLAMIIQNLSVTKRRRLKQTILQRTDFTIADVIKTAASFSSLRFEDFIQRKEGRAVLWNEDDSFFKVYLVHQGAVLHGDNGGICLDCPASKEMCQKAAEALGVKSCRELSISRVEGVVQNDSLTLEDINLWADTLKRFHIGEMLGKYKAVLEYENCTDLQEAVKLAGQLEAYEYTDELGEMLDQYHEKASLMEFDEQMETADEFQIIATKYGVVRKRNFRLEQQSQNESRLEESAGRIRMQ